MLGVCSLFIPSSAPRMINASFSLTADSLIFDLEDAVHPEEKDSARILLAHALPYFSGKNIAVRINGSEGCWREDLELLSLGLFQTVVVPKAKAGHLARISALLDEMQVGTHIAALIESPDSLEELSQIATCSPRVTSLLMGGEDYSLDLGTERTAAGDEILYARTRVANVAAAYHLEALDTPFADTNDTAGLAKDAKYAKGLGFTGKLAINPLQVGTIQSVFYPTEQELHWARLVMEAVELPENKGRGAFSLQGKMIDLPIIKRAQRLLARAGRQGGGQ